MISVAQGMILCQVCGNEFDQGASICPYCGERREFSPESPAGGVLYKVVNLEAGRPVVADALRKLQVALESGRQQNLRVLLVIHGYGSSGKGGAIGVASRKVLEYLKDKGAISAFIPGEDFGVKSGLIRDLLRRFPQLAANVNLKKGNRGVTLVIL